jgi:hypothetical protein
MWRRDFGEPAEPLAVHSILAAFHRGRRGARVSRRRQRQVANGLYSVARQAAPTARRRRHELILLSRAALVRTELLEIAALLRRSTEPDPECIAELHRLLTCGCDSPLLNPAVPTHALRQTLNRAYTTLTVQAASKPSDGAGFDDSKLLRVRERRYG